MVTWSSSPGNIAGTATSATPSAIAERFWLDENKFELYPYSGQAPTCSWPRNIHGRKDALSQQAPTLIYDGDCSICRYWVAYWRELTGGSVVFRAFQEAAAEYPAIPRQAFSHAIQFIDRDGQVYSAAAATFRVLRYSPGRAAWWWCYAHLPGFAPMSEWAYAFFARRRGVLAVLTKFLWGPALRAERYALVGWIFLRLFGAIYLAAFASLGVQILGLIGHAGILPVASYFEALRHARGASAHWWVPSLFWLNCSDAALLGGTIIGAVLGLLVIVDRWTRPALIGLFALYLSYESAGQDFMSFQWDSLLLEVGFLAIFLTGGSKIVIWLYRWLVFRYLFLAGVVKLLSGDATWRDLTALDYHFWTQPLPTPIAWYAAQSPHWLLGAGTAATLGIELGVVFLIFTPRRLRAAAAVCVLLLQVLILLTGNYNFFNLLTMLLCIFLFDDAALGRVIPQWLKSRALSRTPLVGRTVTVVAAALALIVVPVGVEQDLADDHPYESAGAWRRYARARAAVDRQSLWAVRCDDDHPAGDRDRRFRRRAGVARICVPLQTGAVAKIRDVEHSASAAARLANVVRCSRRHQRKPLDRGPDAALLEGSPAVLALL